MNKKDHSHLSRRSFLQLGATLTVGGNLHPTNADSVEQGNTKKKKHYSDAKVAIVRCKTYDEEIKKAYEHSFDLLGGIGKLVKNKTVTIKVNLTAFGDRPHRYDLGKPCETFITHGETAIALTSVLLDNDAKRVRIVECAYTRNDFEILLEKAEWDIEALFSLGNVEIENTRNLGLGKSYSTLPVPGGGYLFSSFELNHSYQDTDVFISLAKMKNHTVAGVTLAMKNLFGITPNTRYGSDAGNEDAIIGRMPLHGMRRRRRRRGGDQNPVIELPGAKEGDFPNNPGYRIPRIIADICAARPIHLSIIDGITAMSGQETPGRFNCAYTKPGVLITGLNPVSTDAVATAVMGYADPTAKQGTAPFIRGDNHILLAQQSGLGTADLSEIEVLGATIKDVIYPYHKQDS